MRNTAIVLLVTAVLAEVALRVYHAIQPSFVFYDMSYNQYRGQPGGWHRDTRLNSLGFNDTEFSTEKAPGAFRIVALGDSFAFGVVPYRYNYLTLLEDMLKVRNLGAEVFNMGIASTSPYHYADLLFKEGLAFKPDGVIVSLFVGNDLTRRDARPKYTYSYLITFGRVVVRLVRNFRDVARATSATGPGPPYVDNQPFFSEEVFLRIQKDRSWIFQPQLRAELDASIAAITPFLKAIRDVCVERAVRLLIVLIPDEQQIDAAQQRAIATAAGVPLEQFDFDLPNRALAATLLGLKIDYLDLLPLMRERSKAQLLYLPRDTHWNIPGNRVAAEAIAARVADWVAAK
ncbi:MAG TPA: SGNH/GDSL hydrolase family protein [Burkholderiales bacterium]|nr:SGNH/GDSL hydrolase family protein [Burkholderiales bacterium]